MKCPFLYEFGEDINCPYLDSMGRCEDGEMEINVGNGDAWCSSMIHISLDHSNKWKQMLKLQF